MKNYKLKKTLNKVKCSETNFFFYSINMHCLYVSAVGVVSANFIKEAK